MIRRQHRAQGLALQRAVEPLARLALGEGQGDVHFAVVQRRAEVAWQDLVEHQFHFRVAIGEGLQQARQQRPGSEHGEADAQLAALPARRGTGGAHGEIQAGEQGAGVLLEIAAGGGQLHRAGMPGEQRRAQLFLQRGNLPAQRRLGNVQRLGGTAEVQVLGEGEEIAQLAEVDHRYGKGMDGHPSKHWTVSIGNPMLACRSRSPGSLPCTPCSPSSCRSSR